MSNTDKDWIPDNPDDSIRLTYKDITMDVPRKAVLTCKEALRQLGATQYAGAQERAEDYMNRHNTTDSSFVFAQKLIIYNCCVELIGELPTPRA